MSFRYVVQNDKKSISSLNNKLSKGHARRMGFLEDFFAILQRQKMYKSFFVMCKYNQKIDDSNLLFHSLNKLISNYPILAATVVTQDVPTNIKPRPYDYIQLVDDIRYEDVIWDLRPEYSNLLQEDLLNKLNDIVLPYDDDSLFWRLGILDDFTLIFITNHVLHDGVSGKNMFQELTSLFNEIRYEEIPSYDLENDLIFSYHDNLNIPEIPKAITDVINYVPPIKYLPEYLYNSLITPKFCSSSKIQFGEENIHFRVNINPRELSQIRSMLSKVSGGFKSGKITLTPFIQSIWHYTVYDDEYYKSFSLLGVAVDSRQFINKDEASIYKFGLNVSGCAKVYKPMKNLTWDGISQINKSLKLALKLKKPLYSMGILGWDKLTKNKHLDVDLPRITCKRTGSTFSNIGIIGNEVEDKDHFQVIDAMFTQHFNSHFYDFSLTCVSTKAGGLNIVITSPISIGTENLERIGKKFHKSLVLGHIN